MTNHIDIYTDGSAEPRNPGSGGWAAILLHIKGHREIAGSGPIFTTNNKMELEAIRQALLVIKPEFQGTIDLFTDSQYAFGLFYELGEYHPASAKLKPSDSEGWRPSCPYTPKKNKELVAEIKAVITGQSLHIRWCWVRSHTGNEWNERADVLASAAAKARADARVDFSSQYFHVTV